MQSELLSLSKIFSESIFRIPDYQRGYSWEEKHLKDFWSDIEQLPDRKNHYTGVLTLEPVQKDQYARWEDDLWIIEAKRYRPLYIVDGQQRLTTSIILLQCILESVSDDSELNYTTKTDIKKKYIFESKDHGISRSYIFGYERDNPSYEYLKQAIFLEQSELHSVPEITIYTKNLQNAKVFFAKVLSKLTKPEKEIVFTKLTQHLQFNIFYIEPSLDVFVTFETMNNRGKPLSHLELLKNRLIYLSTRFDAPQSERDHLRKTINESWKTIYHCLGKIRGRPLLDDSFLRIHFLSYFGGKLKNERLEFEAERQLEPYARRFIGPQEIYKNYLLEKIFTTKRLTSTQAPLTVGEIHKFALDIKAGVQTFLEVVEPDNSSWPDKVKICLDEIRRQGSFELTLLSFIVMCSNATVGAKERILTALEKIGFFARVIPYSYRTLMPMELAIDLASGDKTLDAVVHELESTCEKSANSAEFTDALKNIGKTRGYYSWSALRYFMYEYEQLLRSRSKSNRQLLTWEDYTVEGFDWDYKTVEHIYPQRVHTPYWREQFKKYTIPERNKLRNSLGNLLPVSQPKNAGLSNKDFENKKGSAKDQLGYRYGCLSEIQVAQNRDWGAVEILRRGVELLKFMADRWNLNLGDDAKKVSLLGLGFVMKREKMTITQIMGSARLGSS